MDTAAHGWTQPHIIGWTQPHITAALKLIIIKLGNVLLKKLAVFIPSLYRCFVLLAIQKAEKSNMPMNESDIAKTVSKQNFFALITSFYGKHMMCQCKQKTDGVLLYRTGTDLGITLSKTLKLLCNSAMTLLGLAPDKEYFLGETEDNERQLLSFCNKISDRIHQQINTIGKNDATTPYDISEFTLQLCIDSIDPLL